ncbi:MAG: ATP-binding protein [Chloroflexota bacterium]
MTSSALQQTSPASRGTVSRTSNADRLLDALLNLFEALEQLNDKDPQQIDDALSAVATFFRADAAAIYLATNPGQSYHLWAANGFPLSSPAEIPPGRSPKTGEGRGIAPIHLDLESSPLWLKVAATSKWQEMVMYPLPSSNGRLVLGYAARAPRLKTGQVAAVLRFLGVELRAALAAKRSDLRSRIADERLSAVMQIMNSASQGVLLLDSNGNVRMSSAYAGEMLGYDRDELLGLAAGDVLASRSDVNSVVNSVLTGQVDDFSGELNVFHRYGDPLRVRLILAPLIREGDATPFGVVALFNEISAEPTTEIERTLQERNAQLEGMMSILAHEIRNPLGSIKAGLDYLQPALRDDDSALEDLEVIKGEIQRMDRLLEDALLAYRSRELQLVPMQITQVLDDLLGARKQLLSDKDVVLRRDYEDEIPLALIDRVQMEQVIDNLMVNAIHAMDKGGYLTITVHRHQPEQVNSGPNDTYLEIKVGDSGAGIPSEIVDRVFDPFFTTKTGGSGLGLAVARRIVSQHNGKLSVESWPEAGTIFTILIPALEQSSE